MLIHMDGPAGVHYKQSEREVITPLCSTCVITVNQLHIKRSSSIIIIIIIYDGMELLHHSKIESTVPCITDYNKFMHILRTILVSKQAVNLQVCLKGGGLWASKPAPVPWHQSISNFEIQKKLKVVTPQTL